MADLGFLNGGKCRRHEDRGAAGTEGFDLIVQECERKNISLLFILLVVLATSIIVFSNSCPMKEKLLVKTGFHIFI